MMKLKCERVTGSQNCLLCLKKKINFKSFGTRICPSCWKNIKTRPISIFFAFMISVLWSKNKIKTLECRIIFKVTLKLVLKWSVKSLYEFQSKYCFLQKINDQVIKFFKFCAIKINPNLSQNSTYKTLSHSNLFNIPQKLQKPLICCSKPPIRLEKLSKFVFTQSTIAEV